MPATPAKTGGAGTGNLNAANAMPQIKPVKIDSSISLIYFPRSFIPGSDGIISIRAACALDIVSI